MLQPCCIYRGKLCKYFLNLHPCLHFFNVHYSCVKVFVDGGLVKVVDCLIMELKGRVYALFSGSFKANKTLTRVISKFL